MLTCKLCKSSLWIINDVSDTVRYAYIVVIGLYLLLTYKEKCAETEALFMFDDF